MTIPPDALLGPGALLIATLIAVAVLWREHQRADERERKLTDTALEGWKGATAVAERTAQAVEDLSRDRATRRRLADAEGEAAT